MLFLTNKWHCLSSLFICWQWGFFLLAGWSYFPSTTLSSLLFSKNHPVAWDDAMRFSLPGLWTQSWETQCAQSPGWGEKGRERETGRDRERGERQWGRHVERSRGTDSWVLFIWGTVPASSSCQSMSRSTSCKNPFWIYADCNQYNLHRDIPIALMRKPRFLDMVTKLSTIQRLLIPPSLISTHSLPTLDFSHIWHFLTCSGLRRAVFSLLVTLFPPPLGLIYTYLIFTWSV